MSDVAPHGVRAGTFEAWAREYDRYRPGYPAGVFDLIADRLGLPSQPVVVDVGAGTGKASVVDSWIARRLVRSRA